MSELYLVSGGTSGIGKAVAKSLAQSDKKVLILARDEDKF